MANTQYFNINQLIGKWLERTLWIWLPFYALIRLTKDVVAKHTEEK